MRILLLTTLVPAGPPAGGPLVTLELSRRLEAYGVVERWAVWTYEPHAVENGAWRGARVISHSGLRRHGVRRALSRRLPLGVSRFFRADLARELTRRDPFDVFVADHLGVWQYGRLVSAKRRVLHTHNVESEIYERAVGLDRSALKRLIWRYEASTMARYEAQALREADGVLCLGTRDQALVSERYGLHAEAWYPPVGPAGPVRGKRARGRTVGSVGSMTWQPNRWGMDWFVSEVWPLVRRRIPDARLRLGGRGSDGLPYRAQPGIELLGRIEDLEPFYESVDVVVAPVRGGAGIKVKVMDAAARGLPVVTSSAGIEGFSADTPSTIAVADDAEQFAELVAGFLESKHDLPVEENVAWYRRLVGEGEQAVQAAILGVRPAATGVP